MKIPEKAWEKARRESDYVLSRGLACTKVLRQVAGMARKQKAGSE